MVLKIDNSFENKLKNKKKEKYNLVTSFITFSIMCWLHMERNNVQNWIHKGWIFFKDFKEIYVDNGANSEKIKELFILEKLWLETFEKFIELIKKEPFNCEEKYLNYDKKVFENWKTFSENAMEICRSFLDRIEENEPLSYVL